MFKNLIFILALISFGTTNAQKGNVALGFGLGMANYYGEFNQSSIIHAPKFSGTLLFKNPIGTRFAIRTAYSFGSLAYNYESFYNNDLYITKGGASFKELGSVLEFSFYDVEYKNRTVSGSPYMVAGIGVGLLSTKDVFFGNKTLIIPFGFGYKLQTSERLEIGAEFLIRKTTSDDFDETSVSDKSSIIHNNDYYSTVSLLISYKFFKFAGDCPVYIKKKNYY